MVDSDLYAVPATVILVWAVRKLRRSVEIADGNLLQSTYVFDRLRATLFMRLS